MPIYTLLIIYSGSVSALQHKDELSHKQVLTKTDAFIFPILGSFTLTSIYFVYKMFGIYYINLLMSTYLMLLGCISLHNLLYNFFNPIFELFFANKNNNTTSKEKPLLTFLIKTIICCSISLIIISAWIKTKHWALHNFIGISFCVEAIRVISIENFIIGWILLWGLFIYDIFWVFGTNIMTTIAKTSEAPIKLFLPYTSNYKEFAILGLGDIVLPGLFLSMIMKFDRSITSSKRRINHFWFTMMSYQVGLSLATYALNRFNTGQPSLLYLVPSISLGFLLSVCTSRHFALAMKFQST